MQIFYNLTTARDGFNDKLYVSLNFLIINQIGVIDNYCTCEFDGFLTVIYSQVNHNFRSEL